MLCLGVMVRFLILSMAQPFVIVQCLTGDNLWSWLKHENIYKSRLLGKQWGLEGKVQVWESHCKASGHSSAVHPGSLLICAEQSVNIIDTETSWICRHKLEFWRITKTWLLFVQEFQLNFETSLGSRKYVYLSQIMIYACILNKKSFMI